MWVKTPYGSLTATTVMAVNKGASFGPRVVTAGFEYTSLQGPRLHINAVGELDGREHQDEFAVRRRVARAVVPAMKRAGEAVLTGLASPEVERSRLVKARPGWYTAALLHLEVFEGFERRVLIQQDFHIEREVEKAALPRPMTAAVGNALKQISAGLHAAIDDPSNRGIFGGPS